MKKQTLSLLAVLISTVSLCGCQKAVDVTERSASGTAIESTETQKSQQTLTFDEVNRIEINGIEVSLPFKVEDLGEGYSIGEVQGINEKIPAVFYNSNCVCVIECDDKNNVMSATFTSDSIEENEIKICSLSSKDNFENIISKIGKPTKKKELALLYEYENGEVYFGSENSATGFNYVEISLYVDNSAETVVM